MLPAARSELVPRWATNTQTQAFFFDFFWCLGILSTRKRVRKAAGEPTATHWASADVTALCALFPRLLVALMHMCRSIDAHISRQL